MWGVSRHVIGFSCPTSRTCRLGLYKAAASWVTLIDPADVEVSCKQPALPTWGPASITTLPRSRHHFTA
jgi:hypothetical protein